MTKNLEDRTFALQQYDTLLQIRPNDIDLWLGKASALKKANDLEGALECCKQALKISPKNRTAVAETCDNYFKLNKKEELIDFCDDNIKRYSKEWWPWHVKAIALSAHKEWREAIAYCDEALKFVGDDVNAKSKIVSAKRDALADAGRYEDALKLASEEKDREKIILHRINYYGSTGDYVNALRFFNLDTTDKKFFADRRLLLSKLLQGLKKDDIMGLLRAARGDPNVQLVLAQYGIFNLAIEPNCKEFDRAALYYKTYLLRRGECRIYVENRIRRHDHFWHKPGKNLDNYIRRAIRRALK